MISITAVLFSQHHSRCKVELYKSWSMRFSIGRIFSKGRSIHTEREDGGKSKEIILTDGRPRRLHMKSVRLWIDTPLLCSSTCLSSSVSGPLFNEFEGTRQYHRLPVDESSPEGQTRETICQIFTVCHSMTPHLWRDSSLSSLSNFLLAGVSQVRTRKGSSNRWRGEN